MEAAKINIQVNFQQILEVVKQLSPEEKMLLSDAIWDEGMIIPIEHQRLVLARIKKAEENPGTMLDWDEFANTL